MIDHGVALNYDGKDWFSILIMNMILLLVGYMLIFLILKAPHAQVGQLKWLLQRGTLH